MFPSHLSTMMEYPVFSKPKTIGEVVKQMKRMQKLVDTVMESQRFIEDYSRQKESEAEEYKEKEPPPIFNKRLYTSSGSVVITNEARRIMTRNRQTGSEPLSKSELMVMRSVVDGLKLVHNGHDYIKDALSHVITYEKHNPYECIVKEKDEECLSCYFIVQGAVEVTYDMKMAGTRSVYQPNIIYTHGTGEFLGLVSADGLSEDLSPPATIYTKEECEFLRIDREMFHNTVIRYSKMFRQQKLEFMSQDHCVLSQIPLEARDKILDKMAKQEFPPNRQVLAQGDTSDFIFFIFFGKCKLFRELYIPEADKTSRFQLRTCEEGTYFGEECILDKTGSYCTAMTVTHTVVFKLHKSAFEVVSKDHLHYFIQIHRHKYPDETELRERGYALHTWNDFKHTAIRTCLKERGHMQYLCAKDSRRLPRRPLTACERSKENMYRFMEKGGQYEPVRMRQISANPTPRLRKSARPKTAIGLRYPTPVIAKTPTKDRHEDVYDSESDSEGEVEFSGAVSQMPSDMARLLAKHVGKHMSKEKIQQLLREGDCRELLKMLDENSDVGRQLRMALEAPSSQDGFTKTTVLMTMKTDDIVRKAKELAESKRERRDTDTEEEDQEWHTILHEENRNAKVQIAADRFRVAHLRRKMRELERKRLQIRQERTTPRQEKITLHQGKTTLEEMISRENRIPNLKDVNNGYPGQNINEVPQKRPSSAPTSLGRQENANRKITGSHSLKSPA